MVNMDPQVVTCQLLYQMAPVITITRTGFSDLRLRFGFSDPQLLARHHTFDECSAIYQIRFSQSCRLECSKEGPIRRYVGKAIVISL